MKHMRAVLVLLLSLALAACGDDDGGPADDTFDAAVTPLTGAIGYDVEHYDFTFDLATSIATVEADLVTSSDGDCVTIGFQPDAQQAVLLGGVPAARVAVDTTADTLTACDPAGLGYPAGTTLALVVTAQVPESTLGASDVGYSHLSDGAQGSIAYLVSWVGGCSRHGACDARADDLATYTIHVAHDANTQVLCGGSLSEAAGVTTCDQTHAAPTYSAFGLIARTPAWTETTLAPWGGVAVSIFDYAGTKVTTDFDVDNVGGYFQWMVDTFGAYPYGDELRFVVAPTYWQGFEHPGNIVLTDYLDATGFTGTPLNEVAMHEITHMWAGDQTTLADTYDFVWKESMAEYLSFVYQDEHMPAAIARAHVDDWKTYSAGTFYYLVPDERPELFEYYGYVYAPGPMVLFRQLETMYSRAQVIAALQLLIGTGEAHAISVMDVRAALEASTGADLGAYFDAWVFGGGAPAWPEITTSVTDVGPVGGEYELAVSATTADNVARGAAFTVRLTGAGGATYDVLVSNGPSGGAYPSVMVTPGFVPTGVVIDPLLQALVYPPGGAKPAEPGVRMNPWWGRRR